MRKGWASLALQVQEVLGHDPHSGNLFIFRGRRSDLIKVIWHDGQGMCLFAKRLERGRFIWPSPADGVVAISAGQMGYLLEGIDWRMNDVDPQAWLSDVLARIAGHPVHRLDELLPWHWKNPETQAAAA